MVMLTVQRCSSWPMGDSTSGNERLHLIYASGSLPSLNGVKTGTR